MSMNRIQFKLGMSLFEYFGRRGTKAQCEAALAAGLWLAALRSRAGRTLQCNICHHQASLIGGTLFEGTKLVSGAV